MLFGPSVIKQSGKGSAPGTVWPFSRETILEAQVAMISPLIRKIEDTPTRTCWRLRCCISRIPLDPGVDLLSCTVNLIGDSGHNSGRGCQIGFRLLMQSL